jgi:hypothetical protein
MVKLVIVIGIWISGRYIDEENREDVICSAVVPLLCIEARRMSSKSLYPNDSTRSIFLLIRAHFGYLLHAVPLPVIDGGQSHLSVSYEPEN